jgi:hypothetical protein
MGAALPIIETGGSLLARLSVSHLADRDRLVVMCQNPANNHHWSKAVGGFTVAQVHAAVKAERLPAGEALRAALLHSVLLTALQSAEAFMAGFEGDELQEGIDERLATIRDAIQLAEGF